MIRVLLIDGDEMSRSALSQVISYPSYQFMSAATGRRGVDVALDWKPDIALIELRLPDIAGFEVLAALARRCPATARIVFTRDATVETATKAMRLGACDYLTKPTSQREIIEALKRAQTRQPGLPAISSAEPSLESPEAHAATRWADPVHRAIDVPQDPRTLREFGRAVFVSVGCFRNWCRTNRVTSRASLQFARALRAVYRFEQDSSTRPENVLSIVDQRTIAKFVKQCGGEDGRLPNTVSDFLASQQFIANREAIEAVKKALDARGWVRLAAEGDESQDARAFGHHDEKA